MYDELDSAEGRADLLLEDLCLEVAERGITTAPDEVLTFSPHPAVGGRLHVDHVGSLRLELALRLTGDMHLALRRQAGGAPEDLLLGHAEAPARYPWP